MWFALLFSARVKLIVDAIYGNPKFLVVACFHATKQYCQEPSVNASFYLSYSLNVGWQKTTGAKATRKIGSIWLLVAQAEWKSKRYCVLKKINWVTNRVYHENRPHSSSKFKSFSRSRFVSIASKYSSVILALKVCFISSHKFLFGRIYRASMSSIAQYYTTIPRRGGE